MTSEENCSEWRQSIAGLRQDIVDIKNGGRMRRAENDPGPTDDEKIAGYEQKISVFEHLLRANNCPDE